MEGRSSVHASLQANEEKLWAVNQAIFAHPELAYEEFVAHDTLVGALADVPGVQVTPHAYGIETAFEAEYGTGGRLLVFNAEYDALPGIGHACGHNLIATVGLGAFLAVVDALRVSRQPGRVRLLGTPAEESTGGKVKLIAAGAYDNVDACLMLHPTTSDVWLADVLGDAWDRTLAIAGLEIVLQGKAAHAALAPWDGINALDAAVAGYASVAALRQHIRPEERIHGIIAEGGTAANIVPERARLVYGVRAPALADALALRKRVVACFSGAAVATGCTLEVTDLGHYADLRASLPICQAFQAAMAALGHRVVCDPNRKTTPASTDQGNVSYACPAFQGVFGIPSDKGSYPHTPAFAHGAGARAGFDWALLSCEGMALAGYRLLVDDDLAAEVKAYFTAQKVADQATDQAAGQAADQTAE